jgi:hypothetical protein
MHYAITLPGRPASQTWLAEHRNHGRRLRPGEPRPVLWVHRTYCLRARRPRHEEPVAVRPERRRECPTEDTSRRRCQSSGSRTPPRECKPRPKRNHVSFCRLRSCLGTRPGVAERTPPCRAFAPHKRSQLPGDRSHQLAPLCRRDQVDWCPDKSGRTLEFPRPGLRPPPARDLQTPWLWRRPLDDGAPLGAKASRQPGLSSVRQIDVRP